MALALSSTSDANVLVPSIPFSEHIFDLAFHPSAHVIAASTITGVVKVYDYSTCVEGIRGVSDNAAPSASAAAATSSSSSAAASRSEPEPVLLHEYQAHAKSCRALSYSHDGRVLYSGSSDETIAALDLNTMQVAAKVAKHQHPINVLKRYNQSVLVSGDDQGFVRLWDVRQPDAPKQTHELAEHGDFVSDAWALPDKHHLITTSGDGHLAVWDIRGKGKLEAMSDNMEDELLSVVVIKNGKKVVCGSQEGVLQIFSYGDFGDISDRFPGHPSSIDTLAVIDEDTICTGSSDGMIRIVQIHPNKMIGILAEHGDMPIEVIDKSFDGSVLASCSHDKTIKFWDLTFLSADSDDDADMGNGKDSDDDDEDDDDDDEDMGGIHKKDSFFSGFT